MPNQSPAPVAGAVELAIDALEKLNQRPRPMCRDCADNDGACPNRDNLPCDMRKCIDDARAALAAQHPQPAPAVAVEAEMELFETAWGREQALNDGAVIGADYKHWMRKGWLAARPAVAEKVPLTEDVINYLWMSGDWYRPGLIANGQAEEFARAIERAHGIGSGSAQEGQAK